jgi:N-acetylmuramoyl-L-alanine amidase
VPLRHVLLILLLAALWAAPSALAQSSSANPPKPITLGFDGVPDLSLDVNDFGVEFTGAQVLACGASLNCGPFPPFSGKNVVYDAPHLGGGVITAVFDPEAVGRVDLVSARVTGNRNVTMTAFNDAGAALGSAQTGGANYVGSGTGRPANILLEVTLAEDSEESIARVTFRDSGNTYTIDDFTFRASQRIVVLDPGHGQIMQGTTLQYQRPPSPTHGLFEDNLTLSMAFSAKSSLESEDVTVFMTRQTALAPFAPPNCSVPCIADINKRVRWAEKQEPDLMISIHTNGGPPTANGTEVFYSSLAPAPDSQSLSQFVLSNVVGLGLRNRGVKQTNFNILNSTKMPSALVEVAFHSNSTLASGQSITDEDRLNDAAFRAAAGAAIAKAIKDFYASK